MTSGDRGDGFDGAEFRRVLGHYPTGVTVVTAACADGSEGMTIGSFTSVSLDPPLVLFCPGHDSDSWDRMRGVDSFCVNVLGDGQADVSTIFASKSEDRFQGLSTRVETTGAPVIEGCLAWIECRVHAVHTAGDHDIVVGRVVALGTSGRGASASAPASPDEGASASAPASPDEGASASAPASPDEGASASAPASPDGPLVFFKGGYRRVRAP